MLKTFDAADVHAALEWTTLSSALAAGFAAGADGANAPGAATVPLRHSHALSETDTLLLMPAWNRDLLGLKLVTVIPDAPKMGAPTVGATYLLIDRPSGTPRAVIDGDALTVRRTAAVSALAARYLARDDTKTMVMVGSGHLAPYIIRAHCALRPSLSQVLLWSRNADHAQALALALESEGLPVDAITDLEQGVRHAQLISCATTSHGPIVRGEWLMPGAHLDLVGGFTREMREADDAAIARCRIAVDTYDGVLSEAGDIVVPLENGSITPEQIVADLAQLVRGDVIGRTDANQITLFKSVGTALADLAAATAVVTSNAR